MRLRFSLLLLSLATAAPLLALSLLAGVYVFQRENANVVNAALARNRATLEAVDAELRGSINTLRSLASSPSLARDDLAEFHREANRVLATQPHWQNVVLSRPDGVQLVNARRARGAPLLDTEPEPGSFQRALGLGAPAVGDLSFAPLLGNEPGVGVRLPLARDGRTRFVLTAVLKPAVFQKLLTNQALPEGWVSGLVGNDGRIIARVPPVAPGTFASAEYRSHAAGAREGWYRGNTIEGRDTFTAFSRSALTGWSIGYAIPAEAIVGGPWGAGALVGAGLALSVISALLIGYWLSRRIATPISELVSAARALGTERHAVRVNSTIDEVMALAAAVSEAGDVIQQRDDELHRAAEELRLHALELGRANANKTRFLALLSHELRNPLAPLRTGLAILKASGDARVQQETRAMMERQLAHLTRLIEDLLDIGRIDRGQIALQLEPMLLESAVQSAIESTKPAMEAKSQALVVHYSPARTQVLGDPVRLSQVFINLLGNAAKYTPRGGRIEVQIAEEAGRAMVTVSDSGAGFSPTDAARIFDMFVRLDLQEGMEDPGGLGIGLTLTRSLVELHHGRIEARSDGAGLGATFTVRLPACTPVAAPAVSRAPDAVPPAPAPRVNARILVADDNVDAAQTFAELLRLEGFDVREVHDGEEALRVAREFRPQLVFLDLDMPRMTGIQVAMQLRQLAPPARPHMVALTGWGREADLAAAKAAGFDEHLTKPADPVAALRIAARATTDTPAAAP